MVVFLPFLEFFQQFFVYGAGRQQISGFLHHLGQHARLEGGCGHVAAQALDVLLQQPALTGFHKSFVAEAVLGAPEFGLERVQAFPGLLEAALRRGQAHFGLFFQLLPVVKHLLHFEAKRHANSALFLTPVLNRQRELQTAGQKAELPSCGSFRSDVQGRRVIDRAAAFAGAVAFAQSEIEKFLGLGHGHLQGQALAQARGDGR